MKFWHQRHLLHVGGYPVLPHAQHQQLLLHLGYGRVLVPNGALQLGYLGATLTQNMFIVSFHPSDTDGHLLLPVSPDLLESDLDIRLFNFTNSTGIKSQ